MGGALADGVAGPLGLCYVPALLCLGVIPVVAGLAGDVLGSGSLSAHISKGEEVMAGNMIQRANARATLLMLDGSGMCAVEYSIDFFYNNIP